MGVAGKEVGNMVVSLLQSRGIRFQPQLQMDTIDSAKREIHFPAGKIIDYDFLIGVPPHGLPPVLGGLPILGESGWVKVNSGTLETDLEHIYALGDVTAIPLPQRKYLMVTDTVLLSSATAGQGMQRGTFTLNQALL
jgi:sulfide:quinone oxidoreductase